MKISEQRRASGEREGEGNQKVKFSRLGSIKRKNAKDNTKWESTG